jgi:hypothetical protein
VPPAARRQALQADYNALSPADQTGTVAGRNLKARLDLIDEFGPFYQQNLAFLVTYPGVIDKNITINPGNSAVLALFKAASQFDVAMDFYNWDYDTLTGAIEGTIKKKLP